MGKAYQFLIQHRDRFPQIADYDGFNTRISEAMLLEHMPAVVLNMLNNLKYLPELIVINVGAFDFTRFSNSEQRANIRKMVAACKALTTKVIRPTDNFRGLFLNLMISLPWYVGWKSQRVAHRARLHFNGCLATVARDQSCYIVHHDGIVVTIGKGLYDQNSPGDLSDVGISMFLADIVILINKSVQAVPGGPRSQVNASPHGKSAPPPKPQTGSTSPALTQLTPARSITATHPSGQAIVIKLCLGAPMIVS